MSLIDGRTVRFRGKDEQWLPTLSDPNYEVSDYGRVRSLDRAIVDTRGHRYELPGRILVPVRVGRGRGHLRVKLSGGRGYYVHRLVLEAFRGTCPPGQECCHDNDDPADNRLVNLRWDTRPANIRDQIKNGLHHSANRTHCRHGHLLADENLGITTDGKNRRYCKACNRRRTREFRQRRCAA